MTALAAGPALGAFTWQGQSPAAIPAVHSSFDPWVEVRTDHLRHNVQEIARRVDSRPILAVIKNNAYGLGVVNVGRVLDTLDTIAGLAVVKLNEAVTLRDACIRKPVLLLGPFDERDLEDAVSRDIMPMVYTPIGDTLDRVSKKLQKPIPLHVCLDTGMGRVGAPFRTAATLVRDLASRSSIRIEGVMTTLSEDEEFDREQIRRLRAVVDEVRSQGAELGRMHAASSYALFLQPDAFLDMVRPGMAIYGVYSEAVFREAGVLQLRPAVSLKARVAYVKRLQRGDSAGYGRAYIASDDVWVATLPVGHVDGLPRVAAEGGRVRIGGAMYPIIAAVSASHAIVEIGPEPRVQAGDEVTIFDWEDGSRPEDLAAACGSSVYDLTMHLGPLMPRRVF